MRLKFTPSFLALEWALFVYVIVGSLISYCLPLPEMAKALMALPVWLIIPYFFGSSISLILSRFKFTLFTGFSVIVFSLLSGIFSLIALTFILDLLGLSFVLSHFYLLLLSASFIYLVVRTFARAGMNFQITNEMFKKFVPILIFCVLVSAIPALMKVSVPGFPYGTIETISIPFEQYQPALRFMDYGYLQHYRVYDFVSLGVCSQIFNIDPLSFIWASPFLMMAVFSFGIYLLAFIITKNNSFSLLAVFFGSFLNMNVFRDAPILFKANVFLYIFLPYLLYLLYLNFSKNEFNKKNDLVLISSVGVITLAYVYLIESDIWTFFVPQNLAYPLEWRSHIWLSLIVVSMIPVILLIVVLSKKYGKRPSSNLVLFFIPLSLLAFLNSEAYAFILFIGGFLVFVFIKNSKNNKVTLLLFIFILSVFLYALFQHFIFEFPLTNPISSMLMPKYSSSSEILPFSTRFSWLFSVNLSLPLILLLILGVVSSVLSRRRTFLFIVSVFALAFFLYLFPEVFAYRFFREVSVTMALVFAAGVWHLFKIINSKNRNNDLLFAMVIMILLIPSLIAPVYGRYNTGTLGQPIIDDYEYNASIWLRENTSQSALLVSDYETMQLLGPLSNKLLPTDRNMVVEGLLPDNIATVWQIKNMFSSSSVNCSLEGSNNSPYWLAYGFGKGSISVSSSNSSLEFAGTSIKLAVMEGDKATAGVIHKFSTKQDWSNASGIYFYWYGQNTNATWQVCVSAPDDLNWFAYNFKDDFTGLQKIYVGFGSFGKVGNPSWNDVSYIAIRTSNATPNNWYLGDIGLNYISGSINLNQEDITYLKTHISSTDNRYAEVTGINMQNNPVYIVLSPRTVDWIRQNGISGVLKPSASEVSPLYLQMFENNPNLELVYNCQNQIYIFQVK